MESCEFSSTANETFLEYRKYFIYFKTFDHRCRTAIVWVGEVGWSLGC